MKKWINTLLIILIISNNIIVQEAFATNIKEIKTEKLQKQSAQLKCSCEYRLNAINIGWWENFSDPLLKDYINKAITENHSLKKTSLITEEYRENSKIALSKELPTLGLSPTFARIKTSQNQIADIKTAQSRTNIYAIPVIANYEVDIFLKNHDKTKAVKEEKNAYEYKEKAENIVLAAEVAIIYINIIKLDKLIKTQEKIVQTRKDIFDLTKEKNKAGLASTYDVSYTDKQHTQSMIELNDLKKEQNLCLHKFAVLINTPPCKAQLLPRGNYDDMEYTNKIPECISSEIIAQRPDIMQIEAQLKKAKLDIKSAKKELLPTIPIIGIVGYNSTLLKRVFDWDNILALIGISAFQKLYTGGLYMANLRINKLKFEQLLEEYKQKDLTAMQEINDVLCMIKYDTNKDNEQIKKLKLEKSNLALLKAKYEAGIMSYLDYIQFEETLLSLQSEQDLSKAQKLIDYISLYKVTGAKI